MRIIGVRNKIKKTIKGLIFLLPVSPSLKAKWKVRRLVKRILLPPDSVKLAEADPNVIPDLLRRHKSKWPEKFKELEATISELSEKGSTLTVISDPIKQDILFCYFAYGYTPYEYVCYGFQDKMLHERKKFISDRESVRYAYRLNRAANIDLFMDKSKTYDKFKKFYHRELVVIKTEKDYKKFCGFISAHEHFVKKNVRESCGRGIELIDVRIIKQGKKELFEKLLNEVKVTGAGVVLEELVHQSAKLAQFNSSSVNTVRCITLQTDEGIIAPFCFMKVGRRGSFIDNGGAGGLLIGIDESTGVLNTDAIDEYGNRYSIHPDSGKNFKGEQLPDWNKMLSICKEMATMIGGAIKWIGWDMAYTDMGWIVIEGNGVTEVIGPQATGGIGIREKLEYNLNKTKTLF